MITSLLAIAGGAAVLILASDRFIDGSAGLALRLKLSAVVVGAVVVGFGTSAPELVVSTLAAVRGSLDIGVGNIVGSNIANLSLVLGLLALTAAPRVDKRVLRREAPLMTAAMIAFAWLLYPLTRWGGAVLLALLLGALVVLIRLRRAEDGGHQRAPGELEATRSLGVLVALTVGGLIGTVLGAQLLVTGAQDVAESLGLGEGLVGFTIVAVGTTMPEIAVVLQSGRKAQPGLAIGNVFGSNLFNSLATGASVALVAPGSIDWGLVAAAWVAVAAAGLVMLFLRTSGRLGRWEGVVLLAVYVGCIPLVR